MDKLKQELKKATSINDAIKITNKHYNLDEKLGVFSKGIVISGIPKLVQMTRVKKRE